MNRLPGTSINFKLFIAGCGLVLAICLVYANSLHVPFQFDDQNVIIKGFETRDISNYFNLKEIRYRHLFYFSFSLNYTLGGLNPYSFHLLNIFFHALTTLSLFLVTFITLNKGMNWVTSASLKIALLTASIFGLNPIHTEAVTYISGRSSGMAGAFFCVSLLSFILGNLKSSRFQVRQVLFYLFTLLGMVCCVLSKETGVVLPFVLFLYDRCFMKGPNWIDFRKRLLFFYLPVPFVALLVAFNAKALIGNTVWWLDRIDFVYALLQIQNIKYLLSQFLWPINLTFDYDFAFEVNPDGSPFLSSLALILAAIYLAVKTWKQNQPLFLFALLWFVITIAPTNSVLPRPDVFSERNLYLPSFGLALVLSVFCYHFLLERFTYQSDIKNTVKFLLVVIISCFAVLVIHRNHDYRSERSLWEDTYNKSPGRLRVLQNLTRSYLLEKDYSSAFSVLKKMYVMNPSYYFTRLNLGKIFTHYGQLQQAETEFKVAVKLKPEAPEGHFNLGSFYASNGRYKEALKHYDRVNVNGLDKESQLEYFKNKAQVLMKLNYPHKAHPLIKRYLKDSKDEQSINDGHWTLSKINGQLGKYIQAEKEIEKIVNNNVLKADSYNFLGLQLINKKKLEKAIPILEKALQFNPQFVEAHFNLGRLQIETGKDKSVALLHFESALALTQDPQKKSVLKQHIESLKENNTTPSAKAD